MHRVMDCGSLAVLAYQWRYMAVSGFQGAFHQPGGHLWASFLPLRAREAYRETGLSNLSPLLKGPLQCWPINGGMQCDFFYVFPL